MYWIPVGIVVALIGAFVFWRMHKRKQPRLISLVALVREPVTFEPAVLAHIASKAWKADLGDGESEGADGFVVGVEPINTIMHHGQMFIINSFPTPYTEEVDKDAESIGDMRIRGLFRQHQAWFSCDAMGIDGNTPKKVVLDCYRRLGKLFVELLDDNCLLIFVPDASLAYPINEDTAMALRSRDPLRALQETLTMPIVEVSGDDPLMQQAVAQARQDWPKFVAAYEAGAGKNFSVKAPVTYKDKTEFIWISVTSLEGDRVYGELGNDPGDLGPLKLGSKVSVCVADLNDWCYMDDREQMVGGFTIQAVQQAARRKRTSS
jgi:uncharacterized protein YegJ (DUF2314 family)